MKAPPFFKSWIDHFGQRRRLRQQVMEALGLRYRTNPSRAERALLQQAMLGCIDCPHPPECVAWLAQGGGTEPPEGCPNRRLFLEMAAGQGRRR